MDLIKIGKFIANCRKDKKITQEELANKLYVTDRAVSKWERGLSLPDASKMLDLCNILDINVNELLIGEKIDMKDYENKTDKLLIELAKAEEIKNKKMMMDMWVLLISTLILYVGIIVLAAYTLEEGPILGTVICLSTIVMVMVAFYGLKLELEAGYYECKNCHHKFTIKYLTGMISPHIHTTRYLRCPKCNKKTWAKKVMTKE